MRGMVASIRMSEGFSSWVCVMASWPLTASAQRKPSCCRYMPYISRASRLSSTMRIRGAATGRGSVSEVAMTDEQFTRAFERGEIPPAAFDHRAHVRVAWVYLREAGSLEDATVRMRDAIKRFAAAANAAQKYHETITVLWMRLLAEAADKIPQPCEL